MAQLDPKTTGGEGFDFEDKVSAYFMSFLLSGAELLPTLGLGKLVSIKLQRKVEGWELDDIILEFELDTVRRNVAFSVKSNSQITANKIPDDLALSLWNQFSKKENNPFRSKHDFLGIVTSGASTAAIESLRTLKKFATRHKGPDLSIHLNKPEFTNQHVRELFSSFEKPATIQGETIADSADIIDRFLHFDIDLDDPASPLLREAFTHLSTILAKGEVNDLWIRLQHIAKTTRTAAGEINFSDLIDQLKESFALKGHYNLETDLNKLKVLFDVEAEKINSAIGNKLSLLRQFDFPGRVRSGQINAFIGESGIGKSALLKQWLKKSCKTAFWLPHSLFKARSLTEINSLLGLQNDLFDLFQYGPSEQLVVIDGIDHLTSIDERSLLKSFLIRFQKSAGRHTCIVSSQDQIWKSLLPALSTHEVLFNVIDAPFFTDDEIETVARAIPTLAGLLKLKQTQQIFRNPKYVDLAAKMADICAIDTTKAVSEPILIRGFWNLVTDNETAFEKQAVLLKLATNQADSSNFSTEMLSLDANETKVVGDLVKNDVLKVEAGRVRFTHDLYGDWIRQRFLVFQKTNYLQEIISRKNNVYWHPAIRLLSIEVLEVNGLDSWKSDVLKLKEIGDDVVVDLFFDIAITSLNQRHILESIKDLLFDNDFQTLSRLLERFLVYATAPNPTVMSMRETYGLNEIQAAQINRVLLYSYWPSLLRFLSKNIDSIAGAKAQMAQVAEKWLANTPLGVPCRKEAASIAVKCARWMFELKHGSRTFVRDDVDKTCYQALLAAFPELPSETEELSLKLMGLQEKNLTIPLLNGRKAPAAKSFIATHRRIEKKRWPNGPQFAKDDDFQSVCFSSPNLFAIVRQKPDLARKLLLAAIIENPQEWEDMYDDGWNIHDRLGIDHTREFYPPFYSNGPFLNFLRVSPDHAVDTLIDLMGFVTDRWAEREIKRGNEAFGIEVDFNGKAKLWRGDAHVFTWYSGASPHCPDVVVSYLMALEKWFYERIDAEEDVSPWVDHIIEKSDSLAFIGVFSAISKKSPRLFLDRLKPLLTQPYVIWWDQQYILQNKDGFVPMIAWISQGQFMTNLARQWYLLEHRGVSIEQWALHFFLNIAGMRPFFEDARASWEKQIQQHSDSSLEALCCKFNVANYQQDALADGTGYWKYVPPTDFIEKNQKRFEENDVRMLCLMFPRKVSKVVDDISTLTEGNFKSLTEDLARIVSTIGTEPEDPVIHGPRDCSLAIDGLRLVVANKRIASIEAKLVEESRTRMEEAISNLWQDPRITNFPHDISEELYDALLGKILGVLVVKNEKDTWIRAQVSRLACGPRVAPIVAFIKSALNNGTDQSFILELLNLVFERSKAFTVWNDVSHVLRYSAPRKKDSWITNQLTRNTFIRTKLLQRYNLSDRESLYEKCIEGLTSRFVSGALVASWPLWNFEYHSFEYARDIESPREERDLIDLETFTKAASSLPSMTNWSDSLYSGWVEFCSGGVTRIASRLKEDAKQGGDIRGTPYSQDTWLINAFAKTYFLRTDEQLTNALRSFFQVGPKGHYWLDDFGRDHFRCGVEENAKWGQLKDRIAQIVELCSSIDELKSRCWDADDIWCSIVGLDSFSIRYLPENSEKLIGDLFPIYERWMELRTGSLKCLGQFLDLLSSKVAKGHRLRGLSIVADELKDADFSDYSHERYISTYSNFLVVLWQENKLELRDDKGAQANFQKILNGLISVQDSKALELAAQVTSTRL